MTPAKSVWDLAASCEFPVERSIGAEATLKRERFSTKNRPVHSIRSLQSSKAISFVPHLPPKAAGGGAYGREEPAANKKGPAHIAGPVRNQFPTKLFGASLADHG